MEIFWVKTLMSKIHTQNNQTRINECWRCREMGKGGWWGWRQVYTTSICWTLHWMAAMMSKLSENEFPFKRQKRWKKANKLKRVHIHRWQINESDFVDDAANRHSWRSTSSLQSYFQRSHVHDCDDETFFHLSINWHINHYQNVNLSVLLAYWFRTSDGAHQQPPKLQQSGHNKAIKS